MFRLHLTSKCVEELGRGRRLDDLQVVFSAELQEAFEAGGGVFRTLAFVAVREKHDETARLTPLGFGRGDELVDHDLRTVGEVAELGFPDDERVRSFERVAVVEAEDGIFRERGIDQLDFGSSDGAERAVFGVVRRVVQYGVAVREGATFAVLARDTNGVAFGEQGSEGEAFTEAPVEVGARLVSLGLGVEQALNLWVRGEIGRHLPEHWRDLVEELLRGRSVDVMFVRGAERTHTDGILFTFLNFNGESGLGSLLGGVEHDVELGA